MKYSQKKFFELGTDLAETVIKITVIAVGAIFFCSSMAYQNVESEDVTAFENYSDTAIVGSETATVDDNVSEEAAADGCTAEIVDENDKKEVYFLNPVDGVITSAFGSRWGRNHNGIDIGADMGSDIVASADGTVVFAGEVNGYGKYIVIKHLNGFESAYGHCSKIVVRSGDRVKGGQLIGNVGSTGNSTGPHLHFELKENGEFINPIDYVMY